MRNFRSVNGVLVAIAAVLGTAGLSAAPANADGPVQVKSRMGDVCLDAPDSSWLTAVVVNPCNGADSQRWNQNGEQLESVAYPGNCLTSPNEDRWTAHLGPCLNWFNQHWSPQPNGHIMISLDGCLTVLGGPNPGTWVSTRFCGGDVDQGWDLVP
ncbi:ricin-type beta-trefoil lectin domain protein [Mycobacterium sp. 23]|uniref:Rv1419 family lectin n=1 Tax=Mycobacterium sp. 23 TaxID=3400424 RepID=UPI003AACD2E7